MNQTKERSVLWYILPLVFSIIGALVAYFVLRNDDPAKARNCLWIGIILVVFYIGYFVVFTILLDRFGFS